MVAQGDKSQGLRNLLFWWSTVTEKPRIPTYVDLARIFKASRRFFLELNRNANSPDIENHVQVEIYELHDSRCLFPESPTVELGPLGAAPCQSNSLTLRLGALMALT